MEIAASAERATEYYRALVRPQAERTPAGPSLAPRVVGAFAWAERELGIALGELEPAQPCR